MSGIKTVKISVPDIEGGYVVINEADLKPEHVLFEDKLSDPAKEDAETEEKVEKKPSVTKSKKQTSVE